MDREILAVKTRKDLYDFVRKNPGFHLRELSRALNLSITLADYHLRFLEKHELITSSMDGEYKRFYPRSTPGQAEVRAALTEAEKQILAFLRQPVPLKVIDFLMEREAATHKQILEQVPVSPSTLSTSSWSVGVNALSWSESMSISAIAAPSRRIGTTISARVLMKHWRYRGSSFTSGTTTVPFSATAAPQIPWPTGIRRCRVALGPDQEARTSSDPSTL